MNRIILWGLTGCCIMTTGVFCNNYSSDTHTTTSTTEVRETMEDGTVITRTTSTTNSSTTGSGVSVHTSRGGVSIGSTGLSGNSAIVVHKSGFCDYFILQNASGFIVAEWMGGNTPSLGDRLTGKFNSFGSNDFYNHGSRSHLYIDDFMLSEAAAMEKIAEKCH